MKSVVIVLISVAVLPFATVQAQTPDATPPPQATLSPIQSPTDMPSVAVPTLTTTAEPTRATSAGTAIGGRTLVDANADSTASQGDTGATTLVELIPEKGDGLALFTDDEGNFRFSGLRPGAYELWIWWSPGFITAVPGALGNSGVLRIAVSVGADATVMSTLPPVLLLRPLPDPGFIPYPVRSGSEALPRGIAVFQPGDIVLPGTGTGSGSETTWAADGIIAAALLVSLLLGLAMLSRKRTH